MEKTLTWQVKMEGNDYVFIRNGGYVYDIEKSRCDTLAKLNSTLEYMREKNWWVEVEADFINLYNKNE